MAQAFGRRASTFEARFHPRPVHARFLVETMALVQGSFRVHRFFSCHYYSTSDRYSSSSKCHCNQKDKRPVKLSKTCENWKNQCSFANQETAAVRVRSHTSQCEIYSVHIGTCMGFSFCTSVHPCQYYSTNTPYSSSMLLSLERHKNGTVWLLTKQFSFGNRGAFVCKLHPTFSSSVKAVLYLLLSSAELSPLRAGFEPRQVHVIFMVDKVTLGRLFSEYFDFHLSVYYSTNIPH
jgi:hypothetical protein